MIPPLTVISFTQSLFDFMPPAYWFPTTTQVLNVLYALSIRGYLILVLVGLMIYVTGLSDGVAKTLVIFGIATYFLGPIIVNVFADFSAVEPVTPQSATLAWLDMFGMSDADMIFLIVWIGEIVVAICCLTGAIFYFTPTANDLTSRGKSLIVRALILAPVLAFFHVAPYIL